MKKTLLLLLAGTAVFMTGCASLEPVTKVLTTLGAATGIIPAQAADSINKGTSAAVKAFEKFSPEQEYYIGRTLGATILQSYKPYDKDEVNRYINRVGATLALASDKPETFAGYHFLVLDTDEINAFAAPGGFIFVSRGLLRCCKSEDDLAAVLAHEIGHVQFEHGIKAISKSRLTGAVTTILMETAKNLTSQQVAELTTAFEGSIDDITKTLVNSGYARGQEYQADGASIAILKRVGYDPQGLKRMLTEMDKLMKSDGKGFAKTHPAPKDRIKEIESSLKDAPPPAAPAARASRFAAAMAGV